MSAPSRCRLLPLSGARVRCTACGETFDASALTVEVAERREGGSAPDQSAMLLQVAAPCPQGDDGRDTLHLGYGPAAGRDDGALLLALDDAERTGGRAARPDRSYSARTR